MQWEFANPSIKTENELLQTPKIISERNMDIELDTPYFRRSFFQNVDSVIITREQKIDQFLSQKSIHLVKIEEGRDSDGNSKYVSPFTDLTLKKRASDSKLLKDSPRSSISNFNLDSNRLYQKRKMSLTPLLSITPQKSS